MEAGLRLITERLAVPAAVLFAAAPDGGLRLASAVGAWGDGARALQGFAETVAGGPGGPGGVLDLGDAVDGVRFAAGARLGDDEGALLVLAPDDRVPDDDWHQAFADSAQAALALLRSTASSAATRVLHEVAVHPGSFDDRLALALARLTAALGLDAAAFARVAGQGWHPEAVFDPSGRLVPTGPLPLSETLCALTVQSDGPVAVADAAASPVPAARPGAYLGAPVFVGGRCAGTLSAVGRAPRAQPFGDDDRGLVEALARWVGSALGGRETARQLAAREADLSAFFDAAPMGMGIGRVVGTPAGPDLQIVTVNAAAAALMGSEPALLRGRLASEVQVRGELAAEWVRACQRTRDTGRPERVESRVEGHDGPHTLATTVAPIAGREATRFTFVVEDTTESQRAADRAREREAQIEALVSQAPVALFATDRAGRLSMSRGHALDVLGLSVGHGLGQPIGDLLAGAPGAAEAIAGALDGRDGAWAVDAGGRTFRVQLRPRHDGDGRTAGLIGVALDTTGLPALRSAESAARGALLKHLDHEIRSPLTSILGYADLLSEHTPPDEVAEVRDVINRSGERLLAALDDLLDLTLLDDDAITVHPSPVDAGAVVQAVAEESRAAAEARRLALNLWCTLPEGPVLIDARLFERVVRHLVSGAVAAAAGTRVDVGLRPAGPDAMELSVLGSDPGERVGIGPDLVHRLVRAMGGASRTVDGEDGGWVVTLPRRRVPVVEFAEPAPALAELAPTELAPHRPTADHPTADPLAVGEHAPEGSTAGGPGPGETVAESRPSPGPTASGPTPDDHAATWGDGPGADGGRSEAPAMDLADRAG